MDSNSENKKILVMGGLGLVSCVVIFVSVVSQLLNNNTLNNLGGKELSFGQANYSQEILASTTPSILDSLGDNTNWQQSVNEFVYEDTEVYGLHP